MSRKTYAINEVPVFNTKVNQLSISGSIDPYKDAISLSVSLSSVNSRGSLRNDSTVNTTVVLSKATLPDIGEDSLLKGVLSALSVNGFSVSIPTVTVSSTPTE